MHFFSALHIKATVEILLMGCFSKGWN